MKFRKRGDHLINSIALAHQEEAFDTEPMILKLILNTIMDNNWKIRLDAVIFFRDYLPKVISSSTRFENIYIPNLIELLNDEESYIKIEGIACTVEIMDKLSQEEIEKEFIPVVFNVIDCNVEEIMIRLSHMLGKIVYELRRYDLNLKHKAKLVEFFQTICNHKDIEIRRNAAYNLPCF